MSEYFAQVVKNVASQNLEIRKLVYIYLLRYAEQEPDLALLSINTFQKDLTDTNPLIRAMALRVLSGIRVPMIGSIVVLAIKRCAADVSPYVRKAAALAIPKCYKYVLLCRYCFNTVTKITQVGHQPPPSPGQHNYCPSPGSFSSLNRKRLRGL
jgi:hypothetical protein